MNFLSPNPMLILWQIINIAVYALGVFTLVKLLIVLFKADKAIGEIREYIKRRS